MRSNTCPEVTLFTTLFSSSSLLNICDVLFGERLFLDYVPLIFALISLTIGHLCAYDYCHLLRVPPDPTL